MILLLILALAIAAAVYFLNRFLPFKICAVCAGISGAWLLATLGILLGLVSLEEYGPPILMLMGATAAGIAYQGEKKFGFAQKSVWLWKIPASFISLAVFYWFFLNISWPTFLIEAVLISFLAFLFFIRKSGSIRPKEISKEIEGLKQKLQDCC